MMKIKNILNSKKGIIFILIIVHLLFLLLFAKSFSPNYNGISDHFGSPDANNYVTMAKQLIEDGVYGYKSTTSNAYVTPSQPIYVTSILMLNKLIKADELFILQFFNLVLSIGNVILIYKIASKLFKNKSVSFLASLLYAIYAPNVYYIRAILTEMPTIFFMLLSIYIFIKALETEKKYYYMLFSVFYAITIMFRPALAPLLIIPIIILIKKNGIKLSIKKMLCFSVGFILIILPWVIRNYLLFDNIFLFSSHVGNPLLAGTYPFYIEEFDLEVMNSLNMGYNDYAKYRIITGFKSDPKLYLSWFTLGKFMWLFGGPSKWHLYSSTYSFLTIPSYLIHFIILFTAFLAIFKNYKNNVVKALGSIIVIYITIHLMFIAIDRFGYLIYPILIILSSYFLINCEDILMKKYNAPFLVTKNYFKKILYKS